MWWQKLWSETREGSGNNRQTIVIPGVRRDEQAISLRRCVGFLRRREQHCGHTIGTNRTDFFYANEIFYCFNKTIPLILPVSNPAVTFRVKQLKIVFVPRQNKLENIILSIISYTINKLNIMLGYVVAEKWNFKITIRAICSKIRDELQLTIKIISRKIINQHIFTQMGQKKKKYSKWGKITRATQIHASRSSSEEAILILKIPVRLKIPEDSPGIIGLVLPIK